MDEDQQMWLRTADKARVQMDTHRAEWTRARRVLVNAIIGLHGSGMALREIARATGLPRTTIHRMIEEHEAGTDLRAGND